MLDWLKSLSGYGQSAAPVNTGRISTLGLNTPDFGMGSTPWSTTAPDAWTSQMVQEPGFVQQGSGGLVPAGSAAPGLFSSTGIFGGKMADGTTTNGWGGSALGVLQGLGNSYMAMKQFGLAESALKEQKRQFETNFAAQRKMTNSQLSDRQRARVASNPGAYQSEAEYMKQWGV
jgi:hypothetical protein